MKDKPPPRYFEVDPSVGILLPGQSSDVQVKFMPSEEVRALANKMFTIEVCVVK